MTSTSTPRFSMNGQSCSTCYYYALWDREYPLENQICFRYPPTPNSRPDGEPCYTKSEIHVPPKYWCGEWTHKELNSK